MSPQIDIPVLISQMAQQIKSLKLDDPLLVGIHTGGAWVADQLYDALGEGFFPSDQATGTLDITFYRDDFSMKGLQPEVKGCSLPDEIDGRNVILVDDVIQSGRTIRAAMNELFAYGRPAVIKLAVLIDRPGRQLPIHPDVVGCSLDLRNDEIAELTNKESKLELEIIQTQTVKNDAT